MATAMSAFIARSDGRSNSRVGSTRAAGRAGNSPPLPPSPAVPTAGPADVPLSDREQPEALQAGGPGVWGRAGKLPAGVAFDVAHQLRIERGGLERMQAQRRTERGAPQVEPSSAHHVFKRSAAYHSAALGAAALLIGAGPSEAFEWRWLKQPLQAARVGGPECGPVLQAQAAGADGDRGAVFL